MSEIKQISIPLINYLNLIEDKKSPYYDLILYIVSDMERHYKKMNSRNELIYAINPRRLKKEIEDEIPSKKLTSINISRTILALLHGSRLRKDEHYFVTTSSGGRKNYHIKVNSNILSRFSVHL